MISRIRVVLTVLLLTVCFLVPQFSAQTTEFSYQGQLANSGNPAGGSFDFEFALFDSSEGGSQIGSTIPKNAVVVTDGSFSVSLDFGDVFPGAARFIEIRVRQSGQSSFTTLAPRQPIQSSPYAVKSLNAVNASTASNSLQLGGVAANQYVVTSDPRMTDARPPSPGSGSYIQNSTVTQASSNFAISGNGTATGSLSADTVTALTQFKIGADRVLSAIGTSTSVGVNAGASDTNGLGNAYFGRDSGVFASGDSNAYFGFRAGFVGTGSDNSFFGNNAGAQSAGQKNSFFGKLAGAHNTSGSFNSFFGETAGGGLNAANSFNNSYFGFASGLESGGNNNAFFGSGSGAANLSGSDNTLIGANANVGAADLSFATAIGANASVGTSNTIALGRSNGADKVVIPGALSVSGALDSSGGYSIQGLRFTGTIGGGNTFTGIHSGEAITIGIENSFFGESAGKSTTSGKENSFFGNVSGFANTTGTNNSFFGSLSGFSNNTGNDNSFFGELAGSANTSGNGNSFFGTAAGSGNTTGGNNTFFGNNAGVSNTTAGQNAFFGAESGFATTGLGNAFFGFISGQSNTTGTDNAFFGRTSGVANTTGFANTIIGSLAGTQNPAGSDLSLLGFQTNSTDGISNATAIGSRAFVGASNSLVLGSIFGVNGAAASTNVGIGTTTPRHRLEVNGAILVTGPRTTVVATGMTLSSESTFDLIESFGNRPLSINSAGNNVGIGTTAPTERLEIAANGSSLLFGGAGCPAGSVAIGLNGAFGSCTNFSVRGTGTDLIINRPTGGGILFRENNGASQVRINAGGALQLNTLGSAGSTSLCRNASNEVSTCSSSARYKSNIESYFAGTEFLSRLRPVTFNWKDSGSLDLGLVAEEVAEVDPLLVTYNSRGEVEGVKYDRIGVLLVNVVKEQQELLKRQDARIRRLESEMAALRTLVCASNPGAAVCSTEEPKQDGQDR